MDTRIDTAHDEGTNHAVVAGPGFHRHDSIGTGGIRALDSPPEPMMVR